MKLLYRLLKQDAGNREGTIMTVSTLNLLINLLVAAMKVVIGSLASSIAIVSDGIHNATDAATSLLTMAGTKLSAKKPTKKYPFGFGRIEYLTGLVIAGLILLTAWELFSESLALIRSPGAPDISYLSLALIAAAAVVKLWLGRYTVKEGRRVDSTSLVAVGVESRNDFFVSAVTIVSALLYILWGVKADAWAGIFTALMIFKAGLEVLGDTLGKLLGKAEQKELAEALYKQVRAHPMVHNAADLMLHSYGPDKYSASMNIEVDHALTVDQVYEAVHQLQLDIMHEQAVTMVFGIYAVDYKSPHISEMRGAIARFIGQREHVLSYHALYISEREQRIYCDLVVDYELGDWDKLRQEFTEYIKELYPQYSLELVIETEYV